MLCVKSILPLVIGTATRLTAEEGLETDPALSPDGRLIAYAAGDAGRMRIFIRPVTGGRTIPLTEGTSAFEYQPRWSRDGSQILYLTPKGVFVASALGGVSRRIAPDAVSRGTDSSSAAANAGGIRAAAWSSDGREVLVVRDRVMSVVHLGGGAERLLETSRYHLHSCDWSPRDAWVACVSGNPLWMRPGLGYGNIAPSSIVLVRTTDGAVRQVTDAKALHQSPVWSPDGRLIYFVSDRQGPRDIYAVEVTAAGQVRGQPRRLTTGLGAQAIAFSTDGRRLAYVAYAARANVWSVPIPSGRPTTASLAQPVTSGNQMIELMRVSRDGKWLLYDSNLYGNSDIFRVPVSRGPAERLTSDPADDFAPDLSPNGEEFAFHSYRTGTRDIFVQRLDGGPPQQVAGTLAQETYPVWSPDGRAIAFLDQLPVGGAVRGLFVTRRDDSGSWGVPKLRRAGLGRPWWSPDGRFLAYGADGPVEVIDPDSGSPRVVYAPAAGSSDPKAETVLVSDDGRTLYFKSHDEQGRASLWSVPASGGRPRLLVSFDDLTRPSIRVDFAVGAGRFFFTIEDRQSDIWVAEVTRR